MSKLIDRLEELAGKATPGIWRFDAEAERIDAYVGRNIIGSPYLECRDNAIFLCALRNHLPALLRVVRAAEKCLPYVAPNAVDGQKIKTNPVSECYLNTELRQALADLEKEG